MCALSVSTPNCYYVNQASRAIRDCEHTHTHTCQRVNWRRVAAPRELAHVSFQHSALSVRAACVFSHSATTQRDSGCSRRNGLDAAQAHIYSNQTRLYCSGVRVYGSFVVAEATTTTTSETF